MINLYLDDLRDCPEGFTLARNVKEFFSVIENISNELNIISLDHDLGENEPTGYDLCKVIAESFMYSNSFYGVKEIFLHTANGVGRDNMYQLLNRYKPDWVKLHRSPMPAND